MEKELDIVVYGATGFTGQLCVNYLHQNSSDTRWAIAGRNKKKLQEVSKKAAPDVEILIADAGDKEALDQITKRTKVILSTAGPFHLYSSKLVASCVDNNSHYTDITGENFWVKDLIDKYHEKASEKGIRIIPSCGYDSLPSDLGTFFAVKNMKKSIKRVESYHSGKGGISGGTSETLFSMADLKLGREMMDPFLLNSEGSVSPTQRKLSPDKVRIKRNKFINSWTGPFIMAFANTRVVRRSAALFSERQDPYGVDFTYQESAFYKNLYSAYLITLGMLLSGLILYTPLRKVVRSFFPKPGEGPSDNIMKNGFFECMLLAEAEDGERGLFRIYGKGDPGYSVTSKFVSESALALAHDIEILPGGEQYGGVLTPSTGLGEPLIKRLQEADVDFQVLKLES